MNLRIKNLPPPKLSHPSPPARPNPPQTLLDPSPHPRGGPGRPGFFQSARKHSFPCAEHPSSREAHIALIATSHAPESILPSPRRHPHTRPIKPTTTAPASLQETTFAETHP